MISAESYINCCVRSLIPEISAPPKLLHVVDVMDVVVFDRAEYTSHTAYNTSLLTAIDVVVANDMASNFFFQPSVILSAANCISLHLSRALYMFNGEVMIIFLIIVFTDGDTAAFTVADLTVLDDPSL